MMLNADPVTYSFLGHGIVFPPMHKQWLMWARRAQGEMREREERARLAGEARWERIVRRLAAKHPAPRVDAAGWPLRDDPEAQP